MRKNLSSLITSLSLCAALALPLVSSAQELKSQSKQHVQYKLFDLGTLGGLNSGPALAAISSVDPTQSLSRERVFAGQAETSIPDPFAPNCFNADCLTSHAIRWEDGRLTDLGTLPGPAGLTSVATWVSDNGIIAGLSYNGVIDPFTGAPTAHAVVWKQNEIIDLGVLKGGYESVANAVNNYGEVVGIATTAVPDANSLFGTGSQTRAIVWRNGNMHDLGTLGGTDAVALFVNEHGQIIGESYTASSIPLPSPSCGDSPLTLHAFFWENGKMVDLNTLGGNCTFAYALNNRAQVIGQSTLAGDQTSQPFLWEKGTMKDLGTLGGNYGYAIWLNDAGEVVGNATNEEDQFLAFQWKGGVMTNLGTLTGNACSVSDAINSSGQVVGGSGFYNAQNFPACTDAVEHAVLWEEGQILDLNSLLSTPSDLTLNEATSINDGGEISGSGALANGDTHAFVLIPCDGNHPDLAGCDYNLVDGSGVAAAHTVRATGVVTNSNNLSASDLTTRYRSLRASRNHRYGTPQTSPQ